MVINQGQLKNKPHCPQCLKLLDGFTAVASEKEARPSPGDVTVCVYCRAVLQFTGDLGLEMAEAGVIEQFTLELSIIQRTLNKTVIH